MKRVGGKAKIAVVIASKGRPEDLSLWVDHIARQTAPPAVMIWSVTGAQDLPEQRLEAMSPDARPCVLIGKVGLCNQRNTAIEALPADVDVVAFFDDDYVPCDDCLEGIGDMFDLHPDIVGLSGTVLADGINGPGVGVGEAMAIIRDFRRPDPRQARFSPITGLYGCNMVLRKSAIGAERFDPNLPLYGWQEDVDFGQRLRRRGAIFRTDAFAGVHRGAKGGRVSGLRFGYSQVANIAYLIRKGSMPFFFGMELMLRNIVANHVRALWPEPWVDRVGRVRGNWRAFADLVRGRLHPTRVVDL